MACPVFEIDTRGTCLLCLANCGIEGPSEDVPVLSGPFIQGRQTSFKMLLRYLKIDILKLSPLSTSFGSLLDESESANASLEVLLCSNCSGVTTEFLDLFQIFDEARIRLDEICGLMLNRIKEGEEDRERLEEYRRSLKSVSQLTGKPLEALLNASLAESLRNETKQKCSERLSETVPKVSLVREDPPKRRKIARRSTISKENEITSEKINEPITEMNLVDEESSLQQAHTNSSQDVEIVTENNVLLETDVDGGTDVNQLEIEDKGPPGSPLQEQVIPPPSSPPTLDLPLSPENKPVEPRLPPSSSPNNLVKCQHCENSFKKMTSLQHHMILVHPLIKYAPGFPPNTTMVQIKSAVNLLAFGKRRKPVKTDGKFSCTICSRKIPCKKRLRIHIFLHHFTKIIDLLGKEEARPPPTPERIDDVEVVEVMNVPGNESTSQEQDDHDHPMETEGDNVLSENLQLADKEESTSAPNEVLEVPPMNNDSIKDTPIPSSNLQTKQPLPPPPALNPLPSTSAAVLVPPPASVTPAAPKFPCLNCGKIFTSSDSLTKHTMETHTIFRCGQCQQNFESSSVLATHLFSAHTLNFCAARLPPSTSEVDLEQAIASFAQSRKIFSGGRIENALGCRSCSEQCFPLSQKYQLRTHILETHFELVTSKILQKKSGTRAIVPIAKVLKQSSSQKAATATGIGEIDRCQCRVCSEDFITDHGSITQDQLSSGKVMCMCNYCGQSFSGRANFRLHLVDDHPIIVFSGQLPPGTSESEFNKSVDTLEGLSKETTDKKGMVHFHCPCCSKRYTRKVFLRPHLLHVHVNRVLASLEKGGGVAEQQDINEAPNPDPGPIRIGTVFEA